MDIKNVRRTSLEDYKSSSGKYYPGERAWNADCKADVAMPCATQNEVEYEDAVKLVEKGVKIILEGNGVEDISNIDKNQHMTKTYHDFEPMFQVVRYSGQIVMVKNITYSCFMLPSVIIHVKGVDDTLYISCILTQPPALGSCRCQHALRCCCNQTLPQEGGNPSACQSLQCWGCCCEWAGNGPECRHGAMDLRGSE